LYHYRSQGLLDCVHVDVRGLAKTVSLGDYQYFVSFVDNLSRHYWVYPMRQKFKILDMLVKHKKLMEKQTSKKIKVLQLNHVGSAMINFCDLARTMVLIFTSQLKNMGS